MLWFLAYFIFTLLVIFIGGYLDLDDNPLLVIVSVLYAPITIVICILGLCFLVMHEAGKKVREAVKKRAERKKAALQATAQSCAAIRHRI